MSNWLTQTDVDNYGPELIDVTQRAAMAAVQPHIQNLESQNAELQRRLAIEARRRLDDQIARRYNIAAFDADPRWHRYLGSVDALSGRVRQQMLNEAIDSGDPHRVSAFFEGFQQHLRASPQAASTPARTTSQRSAAAPSGGRIYTRDQISDLYSRHRRGKFSEAAWAAQESDIFAALREGRVRGGTDWHGK